MIDSVNKVYHSLSSCVWQISRDHWRLPLSVEPADGVACRVRIGGGLHLLRCQRAAVESILDANCEGRVGHAWFLRNEVLAAIASPWQGDPEDCVIWHPSPPLDASQQAVPEEAREMFRRGYFRTETMAHVYWTLFCNVIFWRLVNERKPVDFGFATLYASPRRPYFCSMVNARRRLCRANSRVKSRLPAQVRFPLSKSPPEAIEALKKHLCCGRMLMIHHEQNTITWTLDVVPATKWFQKTRAAERVLRKSMSDLNYWEYARKTLEATLPLALRQVNTWFWLARKPYVLIGKSDFTSVAWQRDPKEYSIKVLRRKSPPYPPWDWDKASRAYTGDRPVEWHAPFGMDWTYPFVSAMRNLRPDLVDLWQRQKVSRRQR